MTAIATLIAVGIDSGVAIPNISLIFVVPVVVAGVGFGLGPSLCSAVLGALAYNFFLTEPRYTLLVDDPANIWAIGLLFVIGLIVSSVAYTSRRRATDAALLRSQAAVLQDYGRAVVAAASMEAIVSTTVQTLAALFQVPVAVMTVSGSEVVSVNAVGDIELQEAEFEAARSSLEMRTVIRAETYPATASRFEFWPVKNVDGSVRCHWTGVQPQRCRNRKLPSTSFGVFWPWHLIVSILRMAVMLGLHVEPRMVTVKIAS